jgi:hypothetical protein
MLIERKTPFPWILEDVDVEAKPKYYSYSTGS